MSLRVGDLIQLIRTASGEAIASPVAWTPQEDAAFVARRTAGGVSLAMPVVMRPPEIGELFVLARTASGESIPVPLALYEPPAPPAPPCSECSCVDTFTGIASGLTGTCDPAPYPPGSCAALNGVPFTMSPSAHPDPEVTCYYYNDPVIVYPSVLLVELLCRNDKWIVGVQVAVILPIPVPYAICNNFENPDAELDCSGGTPVGVVVCTDVGGGLGGCSGPVTLTFS